MRRPNTDGAPNKPVTLPRNQLLICYVVLRYAVALWVWTHLYIQVNTVHCPFKKAPFWNPYRKITLRWQFRGLPCATTVATGTRLSLLLPGTACRWTGISLQLISPARHDTCPVSFTFNWVNSTPDNIGLSRTSTTRAVGKNLWMKKYDFTIKLHLQRAVQCCDFLFPVFQFTYFYNLRLKPLVIISNIVVTMHEQCVRECILSIKMLLHSIKIWPQDPHQQDT